MQKSRVQPAFCLNFVKNKRESKFNVEYDCHYTLKGWLNFVKRRLKIAIDGPAGAGKSTVAKEVAKQLSYVYIDTGAMYRALTLKVIRQGINFTDEYEVGQLARETIISIGHISSQDGLYSVFLDGEDVTDAIRAPKVNQNVSKAAKIIEVRKHMVYLQRQMGEQGGIVMDGRDIGTVVLPNAELKIFLTASLEMRARRRYEELKEKGYDVNFENLIQEIKQRDEMDSNRKVSPLSQADDAILIDTTDLSIQEVVQLIIVHSEGR